MRELYTQLRCPTHWSCSTGYYFVRRNGKKSYRKGIKTSNFKIISEICKKAIQLSPVLLDTRKISAYSSFIVLLFTYWKMYSCIIFTCHEYIWNAAVLTFNNKQTILNRVTMLMFDVRACDMSQPAEKLEKF